MSADKLDALKELRRANNYWMVNWRIVQEFNRLEDAVILGYLCSMQDYWTKHNQLKDGKWWFCTTEDMRKYTTIEARKQKMAIEKLKEMGFIELKKIGCPPKRHFHVNAEKIKELLNDD